MKKEYCILLILFMSCVHNGVTLSPGDSYFSIETWGYDDRVVGEIRVELTIIKIGNNFIEIRIVKDMPPFPEAIIITTRAEYKMNKYIFRCLDGWGNTVYGYFTIEKENIILFLDCEYDTVMLTLNLEFLSQANKVC